MLIERVLKTAKAICHSVAYGLTLARKPCFATFVGVGGGVGATPPPLAFPNEAS